MAEEKKQTILILEDDQSLLEAVEHQLNMRGFATVPAKNVSEGLKELETKQIDVIWLDHYLLGKENGLDFVVKLKNHNDWQNIPIFVVSNSSGTQSIQSYMRLGINQYYTKADYDLAQIISDIEYALSEEGKSEEV